MSRAINQIIIHCTATKSGSGITAKDIDRWHREKGWDGIGYHFVIEDGGAIKPGRPIERVGAHARGFNRNSIGVCYTGGLAPSGNDLAGPNVEQRRSLKQLCETLLHIYPDAELLGHRDTGANKDCPCFDVRIWWKTGNAQPSRNLA